MQNWPQSKKLTILATLCLAGFAGIGAPFVHLVALVPEAKTFHRTPTEVAWSVCNEAFDSDWEPQGLTSSTGICSDCRRSSGASFLRAPVTQMRSKLGNLLEHLWCTHLQHLGSYDDEIQSIHSILDFSTVRGTLWSHSVGFWRSHNLRHLLCS